MMVGAERGAFLRGIGLMAGSEALNRVARIGTAVVLARTLDVVEFGVAAVVLTTWEIIRLLTHNGLGVRIVSASSAQLAATCHHVHRLNWIVAGSIFLIQCSVAHPVAAAFDRPEIAYMLWALAVTYFWYPIVMTRAFLAQRNPGLSFTATTNAVQLVLDSILTAMFALLGAGVWSVVLPKLVIAPIWVLMHIVFAPRPPVAVDGDAGAGAIIAFSLRVLASEALNTLRNHVDKLIVGRVLGLEALGSYSFALNAGVGHTQSLATALGSAILPHISRSRERQRARFLSSMMITAMCIAPVVLLQSALAPWYVPLIFGERWSHAVPLLSVLCLSALAKIVTTPVTQLLRSNGLGAVEMRQSAISAGLFAAAIIIGLPFGMMGVAIGIVIASILPLPFFLYTAFSLLDGATSSDSAEAFR